MSFRRPRCFEEALARPGPVVAVGELGAHGRGACGERPRHQRQVMVRQPIAAMVPAMRLLLCLLAARYLMPRSE